MRNFLCGVVAFLSLSFPVFAQEKHQSPVKVAETVNLEPVGPVAPTSEKKAEENKKAGDEDDQRGIGLPSTDKFRITLSGMFAHTYDPAQASLGYEKQTRLGNVVIGITGRFNDRLRYVAVVNPVDEGEPLPSCGEEHYFYPNTPQNIGPNVPCDLNGRMRVDDYRFIALDPLIQSESIREAYIEYTHGFFQLKGGRFILPIGFGWEEVGSMTAKDATHIQRINTEANNGFQAAISKKVNGRKFAEISVAGVLGDGNKHRDYDYFYWISGDLDSNSWPTLLVAGSVAPISNLEVRAAIKRGHTGSKVERLPNFYASKRNDYATVVSARYRILPYLSVFAESAQYTWGLVDSSADLLELPYEGPVQKNGYYYGVHLSYPVIKNLSLGTVVTREELSRDDALIQHLSSLDMYNVSMGKMERSTAMRFYADLGGVVRVGVFTNDHSNPFPWVSGIAPVSGPRAYQTREGKKWGLVVRYTLQ